MLTHIHTCLHFSRLFVLVAAVTVASAQSGFNTYGLQPNAAKVGDAPTTLAINSDGLWPGMVVRFNGEARPTSVSSTSSWGSTLEIQLTAEDLRRPGLAEITIYDPNTGVLLPGRAYLPIGYPVTAPGLLSDPWRKRLYVTTPATSSDPRFPPNSVVVIDPEGGGVGPALEVGPTPALMALSSDGKTLYVVVEGDGVVRRIDPDRWILKGDFTFRSKGVFYGTDYTGIAVMPGKPDTVALSYRREPGSSYPETAIFDNGIKRTHVSSGVWNALLFSPDGRWLFTGTFARYNSSSVTSRYTIDAAGLLSDKPLQIEGKAPVALLNGTLFTSGGLLVDPQTMEAVGNLGLSGGMVVDAERSRILMLATSNYPSSGAYRELIQSFDLQTLYPMGMHQTGNGSSLPPDYRLYRWGVDGLAYAGPYSVFVFRSALAGPSPFTVAEAAVNAASSVHGPIAPGEILSIYGLNLGPQRPYGLALDRIGHVASALANVQVWFDDMPGTVIYTSPTQLNVVAPFGLQPGTKVNLQVWHCGIPSAQVPLDVVPAAPGLFTQDSSGSGLVAVVYPDGSVNRPAAPGEIISVFGTGGGGTPLAEDGVVAYTVDRLTAAVQAFVGGIETEVQYAGVSPGLVNGVFQINLRIPEQIPSGGVQPITVKIAGRESRTGVTIAIR